MSIENERAFRFCLLKKRARLLFPAGCCARACYFGGFFSPPTWLPAKLEELIGIRITFLKGRSFSVGAEC